MRILIVKLSSMGDVIHALPAITDINNNFPDAKIDWLVDSSFQDIAKLHSKIHTVFNINLRALKKNINIKNIQQIIATIKILRARKYDYVVDLQGLWKSAILAKLIPGIHYGFDRLSVRDKFAAFWYEQRFSVHKNQHAIVRLRQLVAKIFKFNYKNNNSADSGIATANLVANPYAQYNYCVLVTHTTWNTKEWPLAHWQELAEKLAAQNFKILLPWGNSQEQLKSQQIAAMVPDAIVLPKTSLTEIASILAGAQCAITVDTGLAHLSAALNVPTLGLYGATSIKKNGFLANGTRQVCLTKALHCAPCLKRQCKYVVVAKDPVPCMQQLTPEFVLRELSFFWDYFVSKE